MSKLGDILQEEALAEINAILTEADSKARVLIREAEKQASDRVSAYQRRAEAEHRAAARRSESAAELTLATVRIQARGQVIALVKKRTLAALEALAGRPNYGRVLEALAEEALKAVEAPEALVVHPDDRDKLSPWAIQKGLELRTDPKLHLGVRIVSRGGRRSVENSLPERLQRAWETLASGVAQRLWGPVTEPQTN